MNKAGYITSEEITKYNNILQNIINDTKAKIKPDPDHPRGCPQKAWIEQCEYFIDKINDIPPGQTMSFKDQTIFLIIQLLNYDFKQITNK